MKPATKGGGPIRLNFLSASVVGRNSGGPGIVACVLLLGDDPDQWRATCKTIPQANVSATTPTLTVMPRWWGYRSSGPGLNLPGTCAGTAFQGGSGRPFGKFR